MESFLTSLKQLTGKGPVWDHQNVVSEKDEGELKEFISNLTDLPKHSVAELRSTSSGATKAHVVMTFHVIHHEANSPRWFHIDLSFLERQGYKYPHFIDSERFNNHPHAKREDVNLGPQLSQRGLPPWRLSLLISLRPFGHLLSFQGRTLISTFIWAFSTQAWEAAQSFRKAKGLK